MLKKRLKLKDPLDILTSTGKMAILSQFLNFFVFSFDETCFFNSDYMAARSKFAQKSQKNQDLIDNIDL